MAAGTEAASASVRVAFWNTWLLRPRLGRNGPRFPDPSGWFAPDVDARASLVGRALAGRFDVAALSECFERSEQEGVASGWPEATLVPGPSARPLRPTSSGLATLVGPEVSAVRAVGHHFRADGNVRDADRFASKGALLVAVRVHDDLPPVEVVSTHLFAGGDLLPIPGHDDDLRHHEVRMRQVDELVAFVEREHDPGSPLLVVGDFNVEADDPTQYADLARRLAPLGVTDVWTTNGVGGGATCTFDQPGELPPDPDQPDQVLDVPGDDPRAGARNQRIDYLWLAAPDGLDVAVDRPRRWAFPGRRARGGPAGSLSDHLALSVTLHLSR